MTRHQAVTSQAEAGEVGEIISDWLRLRRPRVDRVERGPQSADRVEEFFPRDLAICHGKEADLVYLPALAAWLVRDVEQEAHSKAVVVGVGTEHLRAVQDVVLGPPLRLSANAVETFGRTVVAEIWFSA